MLDSFLIPDKTIITAKGDSAVLDVSAATSPVFLLTLSISRVVEQEAIEVSLFTSADGTTWEPKAVSAFPQKFYNGQYPLLVDLSAKPDAKFVRAHWEVSRWGRGPTTPSFEVGLRLREVSRESLVGAQAEAHGRR